MPKRTDIATVLIIGAGPIVIGQACEFDYSGTQACKALKEEGYRVVLVNSNPATIMTDPGLADATYVEPITPEIVAKIIEKERYAIPGGFAVLPTMGGQTALNCALSLRRMGVLEKFDVEMIGATAEAIDKAEDRELFREAMKKIGLATPKSFLANATDLKQKDRDRNASELAAIESASLPEAEKAQQRAAYAQEWASHEDDRRKRYVHGALGEALLALAEIGLPAIIRPSYTLAGTGGGIAYDLDEFISIVLQGLEASPTSEVLVEESVLGWKEYEMEVVRDKADNCIIVCSIENIDPMGVHTGDSITVAPALTLTDKEYQVMRDASLAVLREIGVETGGSNVQFAVNPADGRLVVIEMNPRVSRSSALASKATGFPDREGRGQARGRLHARRNRQRHHGRCDAGRIRADDRLRGDENPALRLREIPRRFARADDLDEVGRRSDGDRPHLQGKPAESAARHGDRTFWSRRDRDRRPRPERRQERDPRCARHADARSSAESRAGDAAWHRRRADPSELQDRSVVPRRDSRNRRDRGRNPRQGTAEERERLPPPESDGVLRHAPGYADRPERSRGEEGAPRARCAPGVQAHRHVRGRVRLAHCLHVFDLRRPRRQCSASTKPRRRMRRRSSFWAAGRTVSAKASSSTIAVAMRVSRCRMPATRPSWSTAIRRRSRPTTTPPIASTSSRSRPKTCSRSSRQSRRTARCMA